MIDLNYLIDKSIFREYDIRGILEETLSENDAYLIGKGFCSQLFKNNTGKIAVGRDGRISSPSLSLALIEGILDSGIDVIDIGCGPTPMLYFARPFLKVDACIMVTGSHNPSNHNGFKMMYKDSSFFGDDIINLAEIISKKDLIEGKGTLINLSIFHDYKKALLNNSGPFPDINVVWDCGNGSSGELITSLVKDLPGNHHVLFGEIDGNFPNHHPDPVVPKNLKHLINSVKENNADLGIAFDGDGDRLGVVTNKGDLIPGDLLTAFLAGGIVQTKKSNKIILDVKSSQAAVEAIKLQGGQTLIWKTGHSNIKAKMKKIMSPLAGEMSGHIFFSDLWHGVDDAPYASLRVLQEIGRRGGGINKFLKDLPKFYTSPEIRIDCDDFKKFEIIKIVKDEVSKSYPQSNINTIDGIRVSSINGWWLLRASNTQAAIIARAEGINNDSLKILTDELSNYLKLVDIQWSYEDLKVL